MTPMGQKVFLGTSKFVYGMLEEVQKSRLKKYIFGVHGNPTFQLDYISYLHIHRNGTKGPRNTYRFPELKYMEEKNNLWIFFILVCGAEL